MLLTACASGSGATVDSTPSPTVDAEPVVSTSTVARPTAPATIAPSTTGGSTTDATEPATPTTLGAPEESVPAVFPEGFDATRAIVTTADGDECDVCVWLADTSQQRSRGLMFVTDLGSADGMAFRYPRPHTGTFWMENTVLPLSIAFFAPDGDFVESFDMEPCISDTCPKYSTPRGFAVAVEVPQGELTAFGMVAGSRLELLDLPCEA